MRLRRDTAVSLLFIICSTRAMVAQTQSPVQAGRPTSTAAASGDVTPTTTARAIESASRFELQRMLAEVDDRRLRLRALLEPADSVLRLLITDSLRLSAASRPAVIEDDSVTVATLFNELREKPASAALRKKLLAAAERMADHFTAIETSLTSRVAKPQVARDYLARTPFAAVIPVEQERPLVDEVLVTALQGFDVNERPVPKLPRVYLTQFADAFSEPAFNDYRAGLVEALGRRAEDVRLFSKAERIELARLDLEAVRLTRAIGEKQDDQAKLDSHIVRFGIPAVAVALIALFLTPLMYRNQEMRRSIITSGVLVELMTVFLLTAAVIILGVDGRIPAEVIGTLLGGVSGYVLGRAINPPPRA